MRRILCIWLPRWKNQWPAAAEHEREARASSFPPDPPFPAPAAADPCAARLALVQLAQWAQRFSPTVGLEEASEPSSLLLDVGGVAPLFGGEEMLTRAVQRALAERKLATCLSVADSLGAAWAMTHFASRPAAGRGGAICIVPGGRSAQALAPLPLAALRLPPAALARLAQLGLAQIGQLLALPRHALAARFGPQVLIRVDQALGRMDEAIVAEHPAAEHQSVYHFDSPVERQEALLAALKILLPPLAAALAARRLGAAEIVCRFVCEDGPPAPLAVGLFQPSAAAKHWLGLIALQLERMRFTRAVTAVRVQIVRTAPLESPQYELFVTGRQTAPPQAVALLIERLSSRLGRSAVVRPRLVADAQPECACGYLPLTQGSLARRWRPRPSSARLPPGERPIWLETRPIAVRVWAVAPAGPPVQFGWRGRSHRVIGAWGPERIETAWWRGRTVRRDYYRVETGGGQRWWLFRRLDDGQWFLHGRFA